MSFHTHSMYFNSVALGKIVGNRGKVSGKKLYFSPFLGKIGELFAHFEKKNVFFFLKNTTSSHDFSKCAD